MHFRKDFMKTDQHVRRRAQIIEVSRNLFFTNGYESTSVAEIIDAVGVAKGTFYHYFRSKDQLLEALIEEMTVQIVEVLSDIVERPGLSATQRLTEYFRQAAVIKADSRELLMPMLRMMYRPENLQLRVQLVERSRILVAPVLSRMVEEGVRTGEFNVEEPGQCGEFIYSSLNGLSDRAARLMLESDDPRVLLREVLEMFNFMEWVLERILGVTPGSIALTDRKSISRMISADKETDA